MFGPTEISGKRVTVMGLGRFGGGVGAVRFLCRHGARVTLTDQKPVDALREPLEQIADIELADMHFGGHREQDFTEADLIVVNPAVAPGNPWVQAAVDAGVPLTSEMNLFWQWNPAPVIGVTGSNGKSTTAALIHHLLQHAGRRSWLGGNIGISLLDRLDEISPDDWVVLELSSFQLTALDCMFCSPRIAVVTNFTPNHLDWHGSLEAYRQAKQTILRWQCCESTAILNSDDPETSRWAAHGCPGWFGQTQRPGLGAYCLNGRAQILLRHGCGETEISLEEVRQLPGEHNLRNMLAAGAAAMAAGIDPGLLTEGMKSFAPLPHRLEFVGEYRGRRFYNDSISTTPESTVAALHSFDAPIVLLAGGYDKQVDLRPMADAIRARAKAAALMGQTADWLEHLIESEPGRTPPHAVLDDFASAFRWAVDHSAPGDLVVLSPGCASYDWFTNFEERGRRFVELVTDWGTDADA